MSKYRFATIAEVYFKIEKTCNFTFHLFIFFQQIVIRPSYSAIAKIRI